MSTISSIAHSEHVHVYSDFLEPEVRTIDLRNKDIFVSMEIPTTEWKALREQIIADYEIEKRAPEVARKNVDFLMEKKNS